MSKGVRRTFYQDAYNDNKVWEVAVLKGGYYLRQYIGRKQYGRGARMTKEQIKDIGILDFTQVPALI